MKASLIESATVLTPFKEVVDSSSISAALHSLRNEYFKEINQKGRAEPMLITFTLEEKVKILKDFSAYLPLIKKHYHLFYALEAMIRLDEQLERNPASITTWYIVRPIMFRLIKGQDVPLDFGIMFWAPPSATFLGGVNEGFCLYTQD